MKKIDRREKGFTLLEAVLVIGIIFVISGIAIVQSFGSTENYVAGSAMDIVVSQLRVARGLAISQRRSVQVTFNQTTVPYSISYQIQPAPGSKEALGTLNTAVLPNSALFLMETGVPNTPMNFTLCGTNPICIGNVGGGPVYMQFSSTGQFTDNTGINVLNGTIFVGIPNQVTSARAITILGGTGRIREYVWTGSLGWAQ